MNDESNLLFLGKVNAQRLASIQEDYKKELAEIRADQARFAKYGTNSAKKAALIETGQSEGLTRERFDEEA